MVRVNVYLPDDLAEQARIADLNVSRLAQDAIRLALDARAILVGLCAVATILRLGLFLTPVLALQVWAVLRSPRHS